ncbi:hypothetical protein BJX99DRAFT_259700 [Aspergillus californicus]
MGPKKKKCSKNKSVAEPVAEPPHYSKVDYNRPQSCPYIPSCIIRVVIQSMECHIPECYVEKYDKLKCNLSSFPPTIRLDDIDEDIGHTVVHFLYTGQYETLSYAPDKDSSSLALEYRRSVQVYHAARTYGLHGLEHRAIKYIKSFGESMSIFEVLRVAQTVFSRLPEDDVWFRDYLQQSLQTALVHDGNLFKKDELHAAFRGDPVLYEAVMKMMVDIYNHRFMYERFLMSNPAANILVVNQKETEEAPQEALSEHLINEACTLDEYPLNGSARGGSQPAKETEPNTIEACCDDTSSVLLGESSVKANGHISDDTWKQHYNALPTYDYKTFYS